MRSCSSLFWSGSYCFSIIICGSDRLSLIFCENFYIRHSFAILGSILCLEFFFVSLLVCSFDITYRVLFNSFLVLFWSAFVALSWSATESCSCLWFNASACYAWGTIFFLKCLFTCKKSHVWALVRLCESLGHWYEAWQFSASPSMSEYTPKIPLVCFICVLSILYAS